MNQKSDFPLKTVWNPYNILLLPYLNNNKIDLKYTQILLNLPKKIPSTPDSSYFEGWSIYMPRTMPGCENYHITRKFRPPMEGFFLAPKLLGPKVILPDGRTNGKTDGQQV